MARVVGPSSVSAVCGIFTHLNHGLHEPSQLFAISMDGKVLGGRLWWIFMVVMSCLNGGVALFVAADSPGVSGLSSIDEEEEQPEETWEFERPVTSGISSDSEPRRREVV